MIVTTCFLQYVAVANKPPRQPGDTPTYPTSHPQNLAKWPAILIAASLHLAWLALPSDDTQKEVITPPKPIMVNWIDAPVAKTLAAPAPKAEPKPEPTLEKPKPKPRPKAVKPQPVVATQRQTAAEMSVPIDEPVIEKETAPAPAPTQPAPAVSSASPTNNPAESDQKPTSLPSLNADYLNNPPPSYPAQSRELGEQGKVLLRVLVNANGDVEQVNLRKSSGYPRLDQAAQDSVKQWRFVPAKRGDQAVTAWVVVPISFSLEG